MNTHPTPPWLQERSDGVALTVMITPNARRTEVIGPYGDALKVRVAAPPADGKANATLLQFIAARAGVHRHDTEILFGKSARRKGILIGGASIADLAKVFGG